MTNWTIEAARQDTEEPTYVEYTVQAKTQTEAELQARQLAWKEYGGGCDLRIYNIYWNR